VKAPATEPVQERVEDPEVVVLVNTILVDDSVQVRPVEGETVEETVTVPVKPLTAVTVMVEVPAEPAVVTTLVGLAAMLKSAAAVSVNVTVAV
jgi:hypothetical protein